MNHIVRREKQGHDSGSEVLLTSSSHSNGVGAGGVGGPHAWHGQEPAGREAGSYGSPSSSAPYWKRVATRGVYELALLLNSVPHLIPKVMLLNWGGMMIFRNLAYMRHRQGPRLKDLGFELIPEIDNDFGSELTLYCNGFLSVGMVLMPLFSDHAHPRGIFVTDIYTKVLNIQCVGHVLRFFTFVSTSLPGPAPHCQPGAPLYRNSISWAEVFSRRSRVHVDPNCGDLIFSGHMFQVTSFCAVMLSESKKLMPSAPLGRAWCLLLVLTVCVQPYYIIASRNHYSVDVVISSYLAPLVWYAMEGFYKTSLHRKGVAWFQWFVPKALKTFLHTRNPTCVPSEKEEKAERDRELQYLASKYKMDAQDKGYLRKVMAQHTANQV
mmetsp:Transcript_966/g.2166  ORF Transcript_966/g.2166 Transcript_966/m.2166 type:complete len:380 (-) Transcript_966:175-1314(-)